MSTDFNPIGSTLPTTPTLPSSGTDATQTKDNSALGKDDFLQLLVSELKNQDPLSPVDNKDTMAQLAQFSSLEQMTNVATAVDNLSKLLTQQSEMTLFTQAASLIGKEVSWLDADQKTQSGVVESVGWGDNGSVMVKVGDNIIDMNSIGIVSAAGQSGTDGTGGTGQV